MKVVWDKAPISTNDVIDSFKNNDKWSSRTIQTMLIRLDKRVCWLMKKRENI